MMAKVSNILYHLMLGEGLKIRIVTKVLKM